MEMEMVSAASEPGARKVSVLVVDDHEVVRWGMRLLLCSQPWVGRCLQAGHGLEAVELAARFEPDVALVDVFLGDESGPEVSAQIQEVSPDTRVLLMSGINAISLKAMRAVGAYGFVTKASSGRVLADAVKGVARGELVIPDEPEQMAPDLSTRERETLELIGAGATNREIAESLSISAHTVKEYASNVYRKLGVRGRAEAVHRAQRLGLV